MSEKLTEQKIEEMIEELLQEEQERLDEFTITIKNKLPKTNRQQIAKDLGLAVGDVKKVTGKTTLDPASKDWQNLAGLKGTSNLEPKDFKGAWAKSRKGTDAAKLAHNIYNKSDKSTVDWASIGGKENPAKSAPPPPPGGAFATASSKLADPEDTYTVGPDKTQVTSGGIDTTYHEFTGKFVASTGIVVADGTIQRSDLRVIQAEIAKHNNLEEIFKHYATIGKTISLAAKGDTTAQTNLAAMNADDLFSSLEIITTLSSISNNLKGDSAGTVFEVALALISAGAVVGGAGGAGDVLAGDKGQLMLSSKNAGLNSMASGFRAPQAVSNIDQLGVNDTIWYVGFGKVGAVGQIETLSIHITGVKRIAAGNKDASKFQCVDSAGNILKSGGKTKALTKKGTNYKIPFQKASESIQIKIGDPSAYTNFEQLVSAAIKKANDAVQKHISNVYQRLESLSEQTKEFLATKKLQRRGNAQVADVKAVAKKAGQNYKDLKGDLQSGYGGTQSGTAGAFQESKLQSLDDLIAETMRDIKRKRKKIT